MNAPWIAKPLGDILRLEYGKPLDDADRKPDGLYPAYGANGEKDRTDKFYFDRPSIIVGRKGSAGEVNLTEEKFWPLDVTYFVTFDERQQDLRFLYYLLMSLDLPSLAKGIKPGINRNEVYSQVASIPPLPEQHRIVAILDEALAAIVTARANTEQNLRNVREIFESLLNLVFTQHGPGWVEKRLAECLQLITYGFTNPMPTTAEGPYMITAKNVVGGRIDFASTRHTSREAFDSLLTDKSRPQIGDVLLTKDGTLGRVAVVDRANVCINQSVALLRPNGRMEPHFMRYLLSSSDYQRRMVEAAGGTTIKHIYITRVDKMSVVYPQSTQDQQRIVTKLDSLTSETQRLACKQEQKLAALDALKQSILHQAFAGAL